MHSDPMLRSGTVRIDVTRNRYVVENYVDDFLKMWDKIDKRPAYETCLLINCGKLNEKTRHGVAFLASQTVGYLVDMYDSIVGRTRVVSPMEMLAGQQRP
jgi:hypothetical protein